MEKELDKYIREHSTPEDKVLEELYRQTNLYVVNPNMVSGHIQGKFLEMLSYMISPVSVLEIGTYTGYSAICLARGLKSGGQLHTIEINDELNGMSTRYFALAGVADRVTLHTGRAQDVIPKLDRTFDLVFIDGDKREYCEYYDIVFDKVRTGGFIIADNVLWGGRIEGEEAMKDPQTRGLVLFNEKVRNDHRVEKIVLPLRDGLMIIRKK
ncbi:MAG TPA: O-methyltransferase [Bacteroidales bacterium]|jgi:predicted O-methyltransferase YrrM|nr:O-methyltransferase [Bacteroidota bacterium]MZQ80231.1 methyltransferase [Bacteroidales bacterium]OPZ55700.1 MAG: putative O-methyltransferase [Bacteroidetes bacterium ADurb.BinA012]HHU99364.1 O-methyltransferase [Bacteroidales bacterium]HOE26010.1 O-methyltransferase [Bacteroidales bacterium]